MITHSSFCNESVVISYGIVTAKITQSFKFPSIMGEKRFKENLTVTLLHPVRTECRCRRWPGRIWQRCRTALGILQIRHEPFRHCGNSLPESELICQALGNIATCSIYPKADIEITRSLREISPTETEETQTLLLRKQPVCRAVLRTAWSDAGATTQVSAPFDLLVRLLSSRTFHILAP